MKNKIVSILIFLFVFISSYSQSEYGKVTVDELQMTTYPQDTTAVAVILSKVGETRYIYSELYGFQFETTLKVKIKILKTEGLEYCTSSINYTEINSQRREVIDGLSGTTYNLVDGKIEKIKLGKEHIFNEDIEDTYKLRKFALPGAKVGSIIEYKYTLISDFLFRLRDFEFQSSIPTAYVSYEITIPEYFTYNKNMPGYERVIATPKQVNESFMVRYRDYSGQLRMERVQCLAERITYVGNNLAALKSEPYLWSLNDYRTKISYELQSERPPYGLVTSYITSWPKIDEDLMKQGSFGGELKKQGLFKDDVVAGDISLVKAKEIQDMVKSKVKWNENSSFYPSNLKDALKKGLGNSSDLNFLLINALKAANFDAYPVVLSTRAKGRLPVGNPSLAALNYVITAVQIDSLTYFTDASAKYGDWNILPENVMVPQARVIMSDKYGYWVDLSTVASGREVLIGQYSFVGDQLVKKVSETERGLDAYRFRKNYYSYENKEQYIEKLGTVLSGEVEDFEVSNLDNTVADVKVGYVLKTDMPLGDDVIYINPMLEKHFSENPFKSENRIFPVNFPYLSNYSQMITIAIPEGYVVDELPKSEKYIFGDNALNFSYRIIATESQVQLQYIFNVNSLLILPDSYTDLQDFFAKVIQKNSEQVVLKKKVTE